MEQLSIYDTMYPKYKITKPIRLIEFFSGYGSQALALKYLNVPFEHWKICEWAIKSIQAYKDVHFSNVKVGWNKKKTKEDMVNVLFQYGISNNYNEPMTKEQISRLNENALKKIIKNCAITNNLVNIQNVKGKDLEIIDTNKYEYILTYSFPCQDLSLAGNKKGMNDTSTRSGMLWEVERILKECKELDSLPQILLMENVPQVHGTNNIKDFNKWQLSLENLGYTNYVEDLVATDFGIPQTRNRCFMLSFLGKYSYKFPQPIPLKLKLKDILEDNVDEKYYLSDKQIEDIKKWNAYQKPLETMEQIDKEQKSPTLTTRSGAYAAGMILVKNATKKGYLEATDGDGIDISSRMEHHRGNVQKDKIQTITTSGGNDRGVVVGTYQFSKSDKFMKGKSRFQEGKDTSDTLQTNPKEGIVLKKELCNELIQSGKVQENDVIRHSYSTSRMNNWGERNVEKNNISPTLDTRCNCLGVVINPLKGKSGKSWQFEQQIYDENGNVRILKASEGSGNIPKVIGNYMPSRHEASRIIDSNGVAPTFKENHGTINATQTNDLRIRKLTPKECFRLMGVKDEDYEKCAKNQSNASLYHLAGDSIVVNVLMAIFKQLF